jgi:hypothetical protein
MRPAQERLVEALALDAGFVEHGPASRLLSQDSVHG